MSLSFVLAIVILQISTATIIHKGGVRGGVNILPPKFLLTSPFAYFHNATSTIHVNTEGYKHQASGYKTFFVLNSAEHEILNAYKYKSIKKFRIFQAQLSPERYFTLS